MRPCEEDRAGNEPDLGLVPVPYCPVVVDVEVVEVDPSWFVELELGARLVRRWKTFTILVWMDGWME